MNATRILTSVAALAACLLASCQRVVTEDDALLRDMPARFTNAKDGSEMLRVDAGDYLVGALSDKGPPRDDELPARRLTIERPFWVSRFEITNRQYARFVSETSHAAPSFWPNGECPKDVEKQAVTHVSWDDAKAYCRWAGVRLLTEIEWEAAARGTTRWSYPFGDAFMPELVNCDNGGERELLPVGSHGNGASPFGIENMAGGVWEWVEDAYDGERWKKLSDGPAPGPVETGPRRVLKGGAWTLSPRLCRISSRDSTNPEAKGLMIGFRVAR